MSSSVYTDEEKSYGLSKAKLMEFKEAFDYFDVELSSHLPVEKLEQHLIDMGYNPTDMELDKFELEVDPDNTGYYNFDAFMKMVAYILRAGDDIEEDLAQVFRLFDPDSSGSISTKEIIDILKEIDPKMPRKEIDEMIADADPDGSGEITFDEFKHMMMKHDD
ncbi:neo-calmodulin-like [Convolutriloba macropyga]|uniref:neo-calmodulin-like n=1 Tax=Convolutriloba macropyga TaxID=536237 RepID=UPI003F51CA2A